MSEDFEAIIIAFCCNFWGYTAADLAGSMRLQYPPNIRIVRVPCSGKVDLIHILRAFEKGADGVCVLGCLEGDCHFNNGNLMARRRVEQAQKILDSIGIEGERVKMYNLSSSEGPVFAQYATEFTEIINDLGPNPIKLAKNKAAWGNTLNIDDWILTIDKWKLVNLIRRGLIKW